MRAHRTRGNHDDMIAPDASSRDILLMEEERHRLARELHDGPMQTLITMGVRLELCSRFSTDNDLTSLREELAQVRRDFQSGMSDLRNVMTAWRLPPLEHDRLREAVVDHVREYEDLSGIEVSLDLQDLSRARLDKEHKVAVFRILQEALRNAHRHAGASRVWIEATLNAVSLHLSIRDNGKGFNLLAATANYPRRGLGLTGMRERAEALGGRLAIDSQPGQGTTILLSVPLPGTKADSTCIASPRSDHSGEELATVVSSPEERHGPGCAVSG